VLAIFVSACVALVQTILRFIHPHTLSHLWWLAAAGLIGFVGNEIAAQIRTRAGRRLDSPALIADGNHARVDGFVSLGVIASAAVVALGEPDRSTSKFHRLRLPSTPSYTGRRRRLASFTPICRHHSLWVEELDDVREATLAGARPARELRARAGHRRSD